MLIISNLKYLFFIFLISSCNSKVNNLNISNKDLSLNDGLMFYKEKPYSGSLFSKIDTITTYSATYVNGKKHGREQKYFYNGDLSQQLFYAEGENTGTHKAWWSKDQLMFEYHFGINGDTIGTQREWHSNGQISKELNYNNGKKNGTQKAWGFTGQITMNYQVIGGERFGLIGSKNCKTIINVE